MCTAQHGSRGQGQRTAMTSLSSLHLVWCVTSISKEPSSHTLPVFFMFEMVTLSILPASCTDPGKMFIAAVLHTHHAQGRETTVLVTRTSKQASATASAML